LERHVPLADIRLATLEQLTDAAKATPHEIELLSQRRVVLVPCREPYLQAMNSVNPSMAQVWVAYFGKTDQAVINLAQQKITWGEYISQLKTLNDEKNIAQSQAAQQLDANLNAEHRQEMAQRQAAAGMMLEMNMRQQEINAANLRASQPLRLQTNCTTMGTYTTCN